MTEEKIISHGISIIEDSRDFRTYRINCNCHDNEHDLTLFVSKDLVLKNQIEIEFQVISDSWRSWKHYLKTLWILLTKGKVNLYHNIVLDKETIDNLIFVLNKEKGTD